MGATLAGMVANPILPSLRDHDLRFILADIDCAMIFIPASFRGHNYAAMRTRVCEKLDNPPQIVSLRADPGLHHRFADLRLRNAPLLGTTAILMEQWNPDDAVRIMIEHRCTHMAGATPFLQHLLASARSADTRLPDLKLFICGGASVPPSLIRQAADYFDKAIVCRVYGSTELPVTTVGVLDPADRDHAADTDGRPGIATVRLAADGEIRARGAQMMVGYLHADDEAQSFDADGYYRSGDQGAWIDGDFLIVTGRIKDIIIRNGENIAPKEIEDILIAHPAIAEIAIVGVPDPRTGERAVAVIVPHDGATPDVATLADFLSGHGVARFKYPESVMLVDALPKNDAGKILKADLRATLVA